MKLYKLIQKLQKIEKDIINQTGKSMNTEVSLETCNDNGEIYYEDNFELFVDDNNNIGLSAINK